MNNSIEIFSDLSSVELFSVSDLIFCGYSSSIYEALVFGKKVVQYSEMKTLPLFEPDEKIPFFEGKDQFWEWFRRYESGFESDFEGVAEHIEKQYFYKFDGMAASRLWAFIGSMKS